MSSLIATTAARAAAAVVVVIAGSAGSVVVSTPLGAQDSAAAAAAGNTLGHAPTAPAIRVSLGEEGLVPGDRGRVSVRTRADGYVVVLHADPAGHVRVLFPLDPADTAERVRGDVDLVVRSRGGGRDAFTAGSMLGDGTVLAAFSATRPFRGGLYAHNGHWDPLALPRVAPGGDAEGVLLALAGNLLPRGTHFDYDVAGYRVSAGEAIASADGMAPADESGDAIPVGANGYEGAAAPPSSGGGMTSSYGYDAFYDAYYAGIFPVVLVLPANHYGRYGYGYGYGYGGSFYGGIDPYCLNIGCPPLGYAPYPRYPHSGYDPNGYGPNGFHPGRGGSNGGTIIYAGPRPHYGPTGGGPYTYKRRPAGSTPSTTPGRDPVTTTPYRPRDGGTRLPDARTLQRRGQPPATQPATTQRIETTSMPTVLTRRRLEAAPPMAAPQPVQRQEQPLTQPTATQPRLYEPRVWRPMSAPQRATTPATASPPPSGQGIWRAPAPPPPPPQREQQQTTQQQQRQSPPPPPAGAPTTLLHASPGGSRSRPR